LNSDLTVTDWIIAIAPLILLGGLLWFFIARTIRFWAGYTDLLKRQTAALERIAIALEKRQ
jgi:hypothetical protein